MPVLYLLKGFVATGCTVHTDVNWWKYTRFTVEVVPEDYLKRRDCETGDGRVTDHQKYKRIAL